MSMSPSTAARRTDRLFAIGLAAQWAWILTLVKIDDGALGPWLGATLPLAAVAGLLLWRRGGSPTAAWGLAALMFGTAAAGVMAMPAHMGPVALLLVDMSLLPMYRRWPIVVAGGLVAAATPLLGAVPHLPSGHLVFVLLVGVQTALLAVAARRGDQQIRSDFEIDLLLRAMGGTETIRFDLDVLRTESPPARRLREVQERIATILQQVRRSAQVATEAASTLQVSGRQLAERSRHGGEELHSAAMTLSQIAVIVNDSAEAAQSARQTAQEATAMAREAGRLIGNTVEQMGAIDTASRRITDIIGVIESIAFQTNLLALNAAVEAARAGEQGRGFAVVAGEVRSLARRVGASSAEVKQLVEDSVQAVAAGNRLVADAGHTMDTLIDTVARVDETFHSLSADTREHAAGIEAIRDGMNQLSEETRQNLVLAEQSQTIADQMAERADELYAAMGAFSLADDAPAAKALAATARPSSPTEAPRPAPPPPAPTPATGPAAAPGPGTESASVEFF